MADANSEQRSFWNERAGPTWVAHQELLDHQIRPHGELASAALAPASGERLIDLGCGCGDTTLALASAVGSAGHVLGVDVSAPMLDRARQRQAAIDAPQVEFRQADAQTADFGPAPFDGAFSRFGVMFFDDPAQAFQNIRAALRPGGRLVFVCWSPAHGNPWVTVPMAVAAPLMEMPPPPPPNSPGMFGLADPVRTRSLLEGAGFADVTVEPKSLVLTLAGGSVDETAELFLEIGPVGAALRASGAGPEVRSRVAAAVREAFTPYESSSGLVELDSAVWLVSARCSS